LKLKTILAEIQRGLDDREAGRYTIISSEMEHRAYFAKLREKVIQRVG